ncbi:hypothetical protein TrVE_jg10976 [Triparma verrucosa]|uniref:EF-hand domain-containing protein n=1 Tax=Triparma verrucosa TaxID=1606542 RepID=A0A9W7KX46_9STRA|nr:hypothetical protein TrVE_jg10976 [Triparma verrucosa]
MSKPGLVHPADVDVPSMVVLETGYQKVSKHMSLEDYFMVWRAVGNTIAETMLRGRGSRMDKFGLFGYNTRNEAGFFLDQVFEQTNRVQQAGKGNQSNTVSNSKFNVAAMAESTGVPSRLAQHALDAALNTAAEFIKNDCSVALSFQPLGIFSCAGGDCQFRFSPEFKQRLKFALSGGKEVKKTGKNLIGGVKARGQVPAGRDKKRTSTRQSSAAPGTPKPPSQGDFFGADPSADWPPKIPSSGRGGSRSRGQQQNNRNDGNSIFPPGPPSREPTPRLTKSALMRLKAENLKEANHQAARAAKHRVGAREMASNARQAELMATVQMLRNKIIVRGGVYGIRGLGRLLKSMDDDGTGDLSKSEIKNGLIDMGIKISPQQLEDVFVFFDKDGSGAVSFEEFMEGLRGELSAERLLVINQAFDAIDTSKDGDISVDEIRKKFNCKSHPAIIDGSATKQQVLKEFLSQWDKARADGSIDRDDFVDFYHDVGAAIFDDNDFETMMEDTWDFEVVHIEDMFTEGGEVDAKQASAEVEEDPYAADMKKVAELIFNPHCDLGTFVERVGASQISSSPTLTVAQFLTTLGKAGARAQPPLTAKAAAELCDSVIQTLGKGKTMIDVTSLHGILSMRFGAGGGGGSIIEIVKNKMMQRAGSDGLRAVARVMAMMDDDGSKTLTKQELKNGLADWGLPLNIMEVDALFTFFDRDRSGTVSFDEFLKGLRGPMSERRKKLVNLAFDVVDKTGDGSVTVDDLKEVYDTSNHPGILDGSTTAEEVLAHFVETWDQAGEDGTMDGVVTREEFMEYYADVGASIDGDDYFELMIRNAWHIAGGEGACANSSNRKVLCKFKDGTEELVLIQNDMGLGTDEDKIMAQLKKEKAGEKHGGVVKIDIKGEGFDKKKKDEKKKK